MFDHIFLFLPEQINVGEFLSTFVAYPPRQEAASFTIGDAKRKLLEGTKSH